MTGFKRRRVSLALTALVSAVVAGVAVTGAVGAGANGLPVVADASPVGRRSRSVVEQ